MKTKTNDSTPSKRSYGVRLAFCAFLLLTSGCAFRNRTITLHYTPVIPQQTTSGRTIVVSKFEDRRPRPELGVVRNTHGVATAHVYAPGQDVAQWVTDALVKELGNAGFQIVSGESVSAGTPRTLVTGTIHDVFTEMRLTEKARIVLTVLVEKEGAEVLNERFSAESSTLAWTGAEAEYERVLNGALQDIMKQAIPRITKALENKGTP